MVNKEAVERGMFRTVSYKTLVEEEKKKGTYSFESIELPEQEVRKRGYNYNLLDSDGIVEVGVSVIKGDIIIGKIITKNTKNGDEERKDASVSIKNGEEGVVDRVLVSTTPDGYKMVKVVIRKIKIPEIGDKFASRAAQKGTTGRIISQIDMPFDKHGITPDIVVNAHALPSRMTINQLMECLLGKSCAMLGEYGDCTPFGDNSIDVIDKLCDKLGKTGHERHGWETLTNGMTGERIPAKIFMGPTYYQRLKHMVGDKLHCCDLLLTEVLTKNGWKKGGELTMNDYIATLKNGVLVYEKPIDIMLYPDHEGSMYYIKNQSIDLAVTGNHRMWVSKPFGRKRVWLPYDFARADEIVGKHMKYKKDAEWEKEDYQFILESVIKKYTPTVDIVISEKIVDMDSWLMFFGIWYAEGWTSGSETSGRIQISVNKQRVKDNLYPSLEKLGYKYTVKNEKLTIYDYQLYTYMHLLSVGAPNKELPDWIFELSKRQVRILIRGMLLGDGSSSNSGCEFYYTSSVKLANQFQQLCLHSGWAGTISNHIKAGSNLIKIHGREVVNNHDILRISVITTKLNPSVNHGHTKTQKIQEEHFIENEKCPVFCLQVPSEVFYIRRNGKACWTGNSRATGPVTMLTRQPLNFWVVKGDFKRVYRLVVWLF